MTIRNLDSLFWPKALVVVGSHRTPEILAHKMLQGIIDSGFTGSITTVGLAPSLLPQEHADRFKFAKSVRELPHPVDLLVYMGDKESAADVISAAGEHGARGALFPSSGFDDWEPQDLQRVLNAAKPFNLRVLGPGSLGMAAPHAGFAALLTSDQPLKGDLALISRSGTIFNATMAWARSSSIGFSGVASLGRRADVDVSDLLDWFAQDYRTRAILVHFETIENPRKFLSAARAAARSKPVVVIRSGASRDRKSSGHTHAARLATQDAVYDAALQRAGVLRVDDIGEMFEAVETISRVKPPEGKRLSIIANGRTLATIAADRLKAAGGQLATINDESREKLARLTRIDAHAANPVVLRENASPEEFKEGIDTLLADKNCDGVLAIAAPTAFVDFTQIAEAIAKAGKDHMKGYGKKRALIATLACGNTLPRAALDEAKVPCYASPSEAIASFMHLIRYREVKELLMSAPENIAADFTPNLRLARQSVQGALLEKQRWLTPLQTRDLLRAYGIPQVPLHLAATIEEAVIAAQDFLKDYTQVALKISSPDLIFKSDVGGVVLGLETGEAVHKAADQMLTRLQAQHPTARITGIEIQPMIVRQNGVELYVGIADDPVFGPAVVFGKGGTSVEIVGDRAIDLAPLDMNLARALIERTETAKLLKGFRSRPAVKTDEIARLLVKLSQIAIDFPEIRELDLNPVVADADGLIALDARVAVQPPHQRPGRQGASRMAITPYPKEWELRDNLKDGSPIFIRPLRPEDQGALLEFFKHVTQEDMRLRFFSPIKEFNQPFLARLVQLDYARAMAFGAFRPDTGEMLGVVRIHANPDHTEGEYAVMVQSGMKGQGLGWLLMRLMIRYAKADGIDIIKGEVLRENSTMLEMCRSLGFNIKRSLDDDALTIVTLDTHADNSL
ncbi:bifunctional acetate--CoA ligase family protein/GNAT family N-acetyltransferase [Pseudovibrio exalbescens]|uniref:bifunctional acetate--CoA ligase family protein/GNAT family N-acetyltransferase n=1 Tax=Pseudovibrio exalbescens TaxID=197461 RepID=UPI00236671BF|nr:bifunctional acetate--CoA ligase family protein/GNAT family N-acetyltransferase [Pseudovibrio exalbescens]MDD7911397.1 bifunctional acetate--CoA ligase family protein/GNAT family N-acetyltransferase [Pseudovibrio exalbescens]